MLQTPQTRKRWRTWSPRSSTGSQTSQSGDSGSSVWGEPSLETKTAVLTWCTDTLIRISLGLFLAMIDASIVATSLYTIAADFKDLGRINWVALAYTLAFVGCSVIFARIADIVGRRNAFLAAFVLFFTFSLGCGFSNDMTTLLVCRTFQGIGGSGL